MKRPGVIWLAFAICALLGLGVLGWFSSQMLRLQDGANASRRDAAVEENIRLALWRMDSAMAAVHGLEAARPWQDYETFHPVEAAFTGDLAPLPADTVLVPSPLLALNPPFVRLHLQIEPDGTINSPQAPEAPNRPAALATGVTTERIDIEQTLLQELRARFDRATFVRALSPPAESEKTGLVERLFRRDSRSNDAATNETSPTPMEEEKVELSPFTATPQNEQQLKSTTELRQRETFYQQQNTLSLASNRPDAGESTGAESVVAPSNELSDRLGFAKNQARGQTASSASGIEPAAVALADTAARNETAAASDLRAVTQPRAAKESLPQALWIENELFFVRRVTLPDRELIQAVWLDWDELRAWLLSRAADLLPNARLEPATNGTLSTIADATQRLAFLPVRVVPGSVPVSYGEDFSFLRLTLGAAWVGAVFALGALALLLAGTLRLSERRGAFVSAVTHELRTPLTTFRMYTEMLSGGMVTDEGKRRGYFDTLRKEADRLYHLVENVLTYSRIERGRARRHVEETTPTQLIARLEERMRQRAQQAGLELHIMIENSIAEVPVKTDLSAVEQVLFNLVDNAAKYAVRDSGAGSLEIAATPGHGKRWCLLVTDNGPGIDASVRKRLFKPFSKSAAEAAHSKPGVGLGLALSRRLARDELGGDLVLEKTGPEGTRFCLQLPLS